MRERYIPAAIMLAAGAMTSILNIINKVALVTALKRLLLVLVLFYALGMVVKVILVKTLNHVKDSKNEQENPEQEETQPEEKKN